jgi:hypothetical protein
MVSFISSSLLRFVKKQHDVGASLMGQMRHCVDVYVDLFETTAFDLSNVAHEEFRK